MSLGVISVTFWFCSILVGVASQHGNRHFGDNSRLRIQVIRHQPCRSESPEDLLRLRNSRRRFYKNDGNDDLDINKIFNWTEKVRFPNNSVSRLMPDRARPGCYSIHGDVKVTQRLTSRAQVFLMVHYTYNPADGPVSCHGFDPRTGCGGWGSCLYCDACSAVNHGKRTLEAVRLTRQGRRINCHEDLTIGIHKNVALEFCMPTKREFLRNQRWSERTWNSLVGGRGSEALGVFLTIIVFDRPQNGLVIKQRRQENYYRRATGRIDPEDRIDMNIQKTWSFYEKVVENNSGFVGCHRIYGNVFVNRN